MSVGLWILQGLLALTFAIQGWYYASSPAEIQQLTGLGIGMIVFVGVAELAGALGLVVPTLTRTAPYLTPLAATGLAIIMAGAVGFHLMRGETGAVPLAALLFVLTAFVAYGRWALVPIGHGSHDSYEDEYPQERVRSR